MHHQSVVVVAMAIMSMLSAESVSAQDPQAPEPIGAITLTALAPDESAFLDLGTYFQDPDGDSLAFAATTSDASVATVSVSANTLTFVAVNTGTAVVTILASDPTGLSAIQSARVVVEAANRAPDPVGTMPAQFLESGQRAAVELSSYFRDLDDDPMVYSAATSDAAVASVFVAGNILTITEMGPGTATVTVMATDPGGLSAEQRIAVTLGRARVEPTPQPPEQAPPQAPAVAVDRQDDAPEPDPVPPRLLLGLETSGHTLAAGQGYVSAGYLGASFLAQLGEIADVLPFVAHAAYGVTDDLTVALGSGFIYYNFGGGDSDFYPYVAPKFRVYQDERMAAAVGSYFGIFLAEETETHYAASTVISGNISMLQINASAGFLGVSSGGENNSEGLFAVSGELSLDPSLKLAAEFRRVGVDEDGSNLLSGGIRYLSDTFAGEAGLAYWLEDYTEVRPIVSITYRF